MYHLPFADASFDTVTLDQVLYQAENPAAVVAEAARLLRPGGPFWSWTTRAAWKRSDRASIHAGAGRRERRCARAVVRACGLRTQVRCGD
jgi:ubiquinone/menaquinone biosynthesis C-methylase UbiE